MAKIQKERKIYYTFVSQGTSYNFNIAKPCYDPRNPNVQRTMLEAMKDEARFRASKDVYILNNEGHQIKL